MANDATLLQKKELKRNVIVDHWVVSREEVRCGPTTPIVWGPEIRRPDGGRDWMRRCEITIAVSYEMSVFLCQISTMPREIRNLPSENRTVSFLAVSHVDDILFDCRRREFSEFKRAIAEFGHVEISQLADTP